MQTALRILNKGLYDFQKFPEKIAEFETVKELKLLAKEAYFVFLGIEKLINKFSPSEISELVLSTPPIAPPNSKNNPVERVIVFGTAYKKIPESRGDN